jgi:hypothetical protein
MGQSWHASLRAGQAKPVEWLSLGRSTAEPEPVDAGATRNPVVPEWNVAQAERNGGRAVVERWSGLPLLWGARGREQRAITCGGHTSNGYRCLRPPRAENGLRWVGQNIAWAESADFPRPPCGRE